MKLKLKKVGNQIYIVDVDAEPVMGDLCIDKNGCIYKQETDKIFTKFTGAAKLISTPEQIDIDNLFDKYLEALAEKKLKDIFFKNGHNYLITIPEFKNDLVLALKETCFELEDIVKASQFGANWTYDSKGVFDSKERERYVKDTMIFIQQLKISKIPECEVLVDTYIPKGMSGKAFEKIKLTNNKVAINKLN